MLCFFLFSTLGVLVPLHVIFLFFSFYILCYIITDPGPVNNGQVPLVPINQPLNLMVHHPKG